MCMRPAARNSDETSGESLELLLDTICNVFGGVIFIAILVALLVNVRSELPEIDGDSVGIQTQYQATRLRTEVKLLTDAVNESQTSIDSLSTEDVMKSINREAQLRADLKHAREQSQRLREWIEAVDQIDNQRLERARAALNAARRDAAESRAALDQTDERNQVIGRLPRERSTGKRQVGMLVKNNRVFWIDFGESARADLPGRSGDVRIEPFDQGVAVHPESRGGFAINDAAAVRSVLDHLNPAQDFFTLFVASDSVDAYRGLRARLTEQGYDYGLSTYDAVEALTLITTDSVQVQ